MTPACTDNIIITRWRHAHQSWVCVTLPIDSTSVITRSHAAYAFQCDTSIIVNNIILEASMTENKHCACAPLLNFFIHILLRHDMKE